MRTGMFIAFGVFIVFPLCLASLANGSVVYRTTDANGNPVFSDRPMAPGAVAVDIEPVNTMSAAPVLQEEADSRSGVDAASGYRLLEITSPKDGVTLRDPRKPLSVAVRILPALRSGDKIQLLDNGAMLSGRVLDAPERGLHVLRARVLDEAGKVLMRSPPISIHVHRTAVGRGVGPAMATPGAAAQPAFSH